MWKGCPDLEQRLRTEAAFGGSELGGANAHRALSILGRSRYWRPGMPLGGFFLSSS